MRTTHAERIAANRRAGPLSKAGLIRIFTGVSASRPVVFGGKVVSKSTRTRFRPACACNDKDAGKAYSSTGSAERVAVLYEEARFLAAISQCRAWGQHFLQIWTELSSFDGDDSQSNTYIPITPAQSKRLQAASVDEGDLRARDLKGRHLQWINERGSGNNGGVWSTRETKTHSLPAKRRLSPMGL